MNYIKIQKNTLYLSEKDIIDISNNQVVICNYLMPGNIILILDCEQRKIDQFIGYKYYNLYKVLIKKEIFYLEFEDGFEDRELKELE